MADPLLLLTGEVLTVGDIMTDDLLPFRNQPRVELRLPDGRIVLLAGLTQDECRACASRFLRDVTLSIGAPL